MEGRKKDSGVIFIGFLITILLTGLLFIKFPPLEMLENKLLDYRFKIRGEIKPPSNIVIAAIDEKSLESLGRWPWPRNKIANLVEKLTEAGAELIIFDVIFSEQEKNDIMLGNAISDAGNVILSIVFDFEKKTTLQKQENALLTSFSFYPVRTQSTPAGSNGVYSLSNQEKVNKYPIRAKGVLIPVPELIREAMGLGHINMIPDKDGTLRWEPMSIEYNGHLYPSLALQAASLYLGIPQERVIMQAAEGIQLGKKRVIPTDRLNRTLIYYYGSEHTFPYISISDILEGNLKPERLLGKIVIIGATAMGIYDLRVTPFSPVMPGVEKHANVLASILDNRFLRSVSSFTNLIILLLSGFLLSPLIARFKAVGASGVTVLFLSLIIFSGYYMFAQKGLWINIIYPLINILSIFICGTAYHYAVEERYARRIRAMFSSYVTERVVNELIKNPSMAKLGGERREITVLFSDIRGFTSFAEKYEPEEVVAILNEYLTAMTEVVFRWEGTLDKFIGDAIVAFWGSPMKQENHAELAVKCALNMIKRLEELQQKWQSEGKEPLDIGIGINTGEVIVGNIGAEGKKMDYTVIGDHVNLGARIESLTRKYNTHILITEFTMNKIKDMITKGRISHVSSKGLEKVIVKGKEKPVEIYEIASLKHGADSIIIECKKDRVVRLKEK